MWVRPIAAVVGPAAVIAAGTMGTGSTASLVLAGAWFRYDLLWIVVITLPALVVSMDSSSRVGVLSGGKGMLSLIREHVHPSVSWAILAVLSLTYFFIVMGQMSVMTSAFLSIFGYYRPTGAEGAGTYQTLEVIVSWLLAGAILALLLSGGYDRAQRVITALLIVMFVCFLIVAVRGFQEVGEIVKGLIPKIPDDLSVPGGGVRDPITSIVAIAGGTLSPLAILGVCYLSVENRSRPGDVGRDFKQAVLNLAVIFGMYSVFVLVAGGFALYPLDNHAAIFEVHEAGQVLTRSLPVSLAAVGPRIFAVGFFFAGLTSLVVIVQLMVYLCLDAFDQDWRYTIDNMRFRRLLTVWVVIPSLLAPFWSFPALLKIILLMGLNIVVVPVAILIVIYLVNKQSLMGAYRANVWRNIVLWGSMALSLWLAGSRLPGHVDALLGR